MYKNQPYIQVIIRGPGGCINYEYYIIKKALLDAGLNVVEENKSPENDPETHIRVIKGRIDDGIIVGKNKMVSLIAKHEPWGG